MEIIVAGMIGRRIMHEDLESGEDGRMKLLMGKQSKKFEKINIKTRK